MSNEKRNHKIEFTKRKKQKKHEKTTTEITEIEEKIKILKNKLKIKNFLQFYSSSSPPSSSSVTSPSSSTPSNIDKLLNEAAPHDIDILQYIQQLSTFNHLPISNNTINGLHSDEFNTPSTIQSFVIPHALLQYDVLAEAPTGSGKTLAFLIPVLETLYRSNWISYYGLGALIITPTRELAIQIYDVLTKVGKYHEFSAGCLIGGKDIEAEKSRVQSLNIVVATPGRLLQHMNESPSWDASNLLMLVVDEADRLVDLGFYNCMKDIVSELPTDRQTLLLSATLKSAVKKLALFSLNPSAIQISIGKEKNAATEGRLKQTYMVVPLEQKVAMLFSFLRAHSQKKVLVFVSSCKQVRYIYEAFKILKPGGSILQMHGRQAQQKRLDVFHTFSNRESCVALISTDLNSRGIDFPAVDWVVQVDCPDSVDTYIHRVGRTARYSNKGAAVLMLCPSELEFLKLLSKKEISLERAHIDPRKAVNIEGKLSSLLAKYPAIKYLAQKSIVSYIRSISLMSNKDVFDCNKIPVNEFAASLGLPFAPTNKLIHDADIKGGKQKLEEEEEEDDEEDVQPILVNPLKEKKNMTKLQRLKEKIRLRKLEKKLVTERGEEKEEVPSVLNNTEVNTPWGASLEGDEESDSEFMIERRNVELNDEVDDSNMKKPLLVSARKRLRFRSDGTAKLRGMATQGWNAHKTFEDSSDEEGDTSQSGGMGFALLEKELHAESSAANEDMESTGDMQLSHVDALKRRLNEVQADDKNRDRERVRQKHMKQKLKANEIHSSISETPELNDEGDGSPSIASSDSTAERSDADVPSKMKNIKSTSRCVDTSNEVHELENLALQVLQ